MKIATFGASYSKNSINRALAHYTARQFENAEIDFIDLSEYQLPLFTVDVEAEKGIPQAVKSFYNRIEKADLFVISLSEHNGSYAAAFKNLFDWTSRHELKMFEGKKMLLLSTSPGGRGGLGVMETALVRFPIHGADIIAHFSLPKYYDNFNEEDGILDQALKIQFEEAVDKVRESYS